MNNKKYYLEQAISIVEMEGYNIDNYKKNLIKYYMKGKINMSDLKELVNNQGKLYYSIRLDDLNYEFCTFPSIDNGDDIPQKRKSRHNYFKTEYESALLIDKINFLLALQFIHDRLCPEHIPDWKNNEEPKYTIYYSYYLNMYTYNTKFENDYNSIVFPNAKIAQEVCDILNKEKEPR